MPKAEKGSQRNQVLGMKGTNKKSRIFSLSTTPSILTGNVFYSLYFHQLCPKIVNLQLLFSSNLPGNSQFKKKKNSTANVKIHEISNADRESIPRSSHLPRVVANFKS
jgi:hypothetical protein